MGVHASVTFGHSRTGESGGSGGRAVGPGGRTVEREGRAVESGGREGRSADTALFALLMELSGSAT